MVRLLVQILVVVAVIPLSAVGVSATHVGCGDTITADTTLDSDLTDCPGDGLIIGASGITLDLNGHTIDGNGAASATTGVVNTGHDNVLVTNGTIRDFFEGIKMQSGVNDTFMTDLSIDAVWGILFLGGTGNTMARNAITNTLSASPGDSIKLDGVGLSTIVDNRTFGSTAKGIFLFRSSSNEVRHNMVVGNAAQGIHVNESDSNVIVDNTANFNLDGIVIDAGDGNNVVSNFVENNSDESIVVGATNTTVQANIVRSFGALGIVVHGDGTTVEGNVARRNTDGIFVGSGATATSILNNHAFRNSDDGIDVDSADTSIGGNTANNNGDLGIEAVAGVTDLGGNSATGNGNPAQCTNVAC